MKHQMDHSSARVNVAIFVGPTAARTLLSPGLACYQLCYKSVVLVALSVLHFPASNTNIDINTNTNNNFKIHINSM